MKNKNKKSNNARLAWLDINHSFLNCISTNSEAHIGHVCTKQSHSYSHSYVMLQLLPVLSVDSQQHYTFLLSPTQ